MQRTIMVFTSLAVACSSSSGGDTVDSGTSLDGSIDSGIDSGAPSAPTELVVVLQGQDGANQTASPPTPQDPDRMDLAWTAAVPGDHPIDHYRIYRSTDGTTYTAYDTATGPAYSDTHATGCVNGNAGASAPYYAATTYWYEVAAVDTADLEGPRSTSQSFIVYKNGTFNWGGDYNYGGLTTSYQDSTGGAGSDAQDIKVSVNGAYGGWLPFSGNLVTEWNLWAGAFGYLELDLKPTTSNQKWQLSPVRVGDVLIYNEHGSAASFDPTDYGPAPVAGTWGHYKIPLTELLADYGSNGAGPVAIQYAVYKFGLQDATGTATGTWYVDNVMYTPK